MYQEGVGACNRAYPTLPTYHTLTPTLLFLFHGISLSHDEFLAEIFDRPQNLCTE